MLEVTSKDTFEPTMVKLKFAKMVDELNLSAASNHVLVIVPEIRPDGTEIKTALRVPDITRIRDLEDDNAFIG